MTAPARIRQDDVTRLMKGARAAGYTRVRLTVDVVGNIVVDASDDPESLPAGGQNPWDQVLKQ